MNSELHLERKTGKELIEICKNMKIKGYSKKNKKESHSFSNKISHFVNNFG